MTCLERKEESKMKQIIMENLSFSYLARPDHMVLDDISLEIDEGQFITFCGRSGSGKSTLLRHLKTTVAPAGTKKGNVMIHGIPLQNMSFREQSEKIGYVMQNPDTQIVTDKVWHELAFGLESLGYDTLTIRRKVAEMASYFGIQNWFHKNVRELSGGEKQLLNLASIMVMQPEILILDEPTSQLDPVQGSSFLNTIRKINLDLGVTILISEHRLEEVMPCSDKVVVLEQGKLIAFDNPKRAGASLWENGNKMAEALPTAMQIYFGTGLREAPPLTVREGRAWLTDYLSDVTLPEWNKKELTKWDNKKTAIQLKDVWFRYDKDSKDVLKGVSFEVKERSFHAIVGGNGTGKSTALKITAGLRKPDSGKVYLLGKERHKYKKNIPAVSMLPQDPLSLFAKGTVKEELEEMSKDMEMIERLAKLTEITGLMEQNPYDLSGGEQQRVALTKVLLTKPQILLLDEPTKGMDPFMKEKLGILIQELIQNGLTILIISHDIEFCAKYADYATMFFDGIVISSAPASQFFAANHFYTTQANRMSRHICSDLVTIEDVVKFCKESRQELC